MTLDSFVKKLMTGAAFVGAGLTAQKADAQTQVDFDPIHSVNTTAPIRGIAGNEDNYFLTYSGDWSTINKNLTNKTFLNDPSNPTFAKDAASFITG